MAVWTDATDAAEPPAAGEPRGRGRATPPMPQAQSRRHRLQAMMRQDILSAARQLLQSGGVQALSMRALGQAVGVTAPTLYDYFPAKEAVLDALYQEGAERLYAEIEAAIEQTAPGLAQLRAIGIAYRAFALAHPDLYLLLFGRVDASYRPGDEQLQCGFGVYELVVRAHQAAMACGALKPGDPTATAFAAWTLAHGTISLEINGMATKCGNASGVADPAAAYRANFELLLQGLAAEPTP